MGVGLFEQARSRLAAGELDVAGRLALRAREVFVDAGANDDACAAASLQGRILLRGGDLSSALVASAWAYDHAESNDLVSRALGALTEMGAIRELAGDLDAAFACHDEVLARQRTLADDVGVATAAGNVGRLLVRMLATDRARELLQESLDLFRRSKRDAGVANALICLGDLSRVEGRLAAAAQAFGEAYETAQAARLPELATLARLNEGYVQRDRGNAGDAIEAFRDSHALAMSLGDHAGIARARLGEAMARADCDQPEAAIEAFDAAEAAFRKAGITAVAVTVNRAALHCRLGRLEAGARGFAAARQTLLESGDRLGAFEVALALAEVQLVVGDHDAVRALIDGPVEEGLPSRLHLRRHLIGVHILVRGCRLVEAAAQLAALRADLDEPTRSEAFSLDLFRYEVEGLLGRLDVAQQEAALIEQVDPAHQPREYGALLLARAHRAAWAGELTVAATRFDAATILWQARGEQLRVLHARLGGWRIAALRGLEVDISEVVAAQAVLADAGAVHDAVSTGHFIDALRVRASGTADAAPREQAVAALVASCLAAAERGHALTAVLDTMIAAVVTGDGGLTAAVATLVARFGIDPPMWYSGRSQQVPRS